MTANYSLICNELKKVSDRVTNIEEQSPPVVPSPTPNGEQSLSDKQNQTVEAAVKSEQSPYGKI